VAMKQPSYIFSAWENYREWESTCPDCTWVGPLSQATPDYETAMVSSLHCPKCDRKLALMNNQASYEEIVEMAARGVQKAIRHLESMREQEGE